MEDFRRKIVGIVKQRKGSWSQRLEMEELMAPFLWNAVAGGSFQRNEKNPLQSLVFSSFVLVQGKSSEKERELGKAPLEEPANPFRCSRPAMAPVAAVAIASCVDLLLLSWLALIRFCQASSACCYLALTC